MASIVSKRVFDQPRSARILETLVRAGILLTLLVPLFVERELFYPFSSSKGFLFLAAVQGTFGAWCLLISLDSVYRPKWNTIHISLLALVACMALSTFLSHDTNRSVWSTYERMSGLVIQIHLYVFFLILSSFLKEQRDWIQFFYASATVAAIVSAIGLFDSFSAASVVPLSQGGAPLSPAAIAEIPRSGSTLGNTSFLGSYLQINAFFSIYLFFSGSRKQKRGAALLIAIISAGIFLSPGGRAVKATYLLGVGIVALAKRLINSKSIRLQKSASTALLLSVPLGVMAGALLAFKCEPLLSDSLKVKGVTERVVNWKAAGEGFFERPILGWGPENYDLMFFKNFDPAILVSTGRIISDPWFDRAHNIIFDLLVSVGLLGFSIYIIAMMAAVFLLKRTMLQDKARGTNAYIVFTTLLLCHFLQNLTVFDMLSSSILLYALYAFASHQSPPSLVSPRGSGHSIPPPRIFVPLGALGLSLLLLSYWHCVHTPRALARIVQELESVPNEHDVLSEFKVVSNAATVGRHQVRVRLAELATNRLGSAGDAEAGAPKLRELDYVLGELGKSAAESPLNYRIPFTAGQLGAAASVWSYEVLGEQDDAQVTAVRYVDASINAYKRALEICNNHPLGYLEMSKALVYKGYISGDPAFFKEALEVAETAIKWEPRLFASHDLAVDIAASLLADERLAWEKIDAGAKINPSWKRKLIKRAREAEGFHSD